MKLAEKIIAWAEARSPDYVIGGHESPYLLRWYLIPQNPLFNIYVHLFLRSDDDRAHHDHPWMNFSKLLRNEYCEHRILQGGVMERTIRRAGDWTFRFSGRIAHRIELTTGPCWTLFITGPKYREWGFHCPDQGWIHWKRFTAEHDEGAVGKGCEG